MTATHCRQGCAARTRPPPSFPLVARAPLSDTRGACAQRSLAKHKKEIALLSSAAQRAKKEEERLRREAQAATAAVGVAPRGTPEEAKPGATPFTTHHTSLPSPPPPPPPPRPRAHVYTFTAPPLQAARGRAQGRAAPSRRRACIRLALRPLGPAESRGPTILARNFAPILSPVVAPLVARAVGD